MASESPLTLLIREIDTGPPPWRLRGTLSPMLARERIYRAAADELRHKHDTGRDYTLESDIRFRWLLEWADILAGTRQHFSYGLESSMRFAFMPVASLLSPRDLAAGERLENETLTLAQGS